MVTEGDAPRVLRWLAVIGDTFDRRLKPTETLRAAIDARRDLRFALFRVFAAEKREKEGERSVLRVSFDFVRRLCGSKWAPTDVLPLLAVAQAEVDSGAAGHYYELAIELGLAFASETNSDWEAVCYAATSDDWRERRDRRLLSPWDPEAFAWKRKQLDRRDQKEQKLATWRDDMALRATAMASGEDTNALLAMADVYCGLYTDVLRDGSPHERIAQSFGATVADAAHAGMIQRVRVDQLFTPGETGRCAARSMRWTCGWMWLAGATEMWRRTPTAVTRLSQERREALMALALQLRCPFGEADGKTHEWPWLDALIPIFYVWLGPSIPKNEISYVVQ